MASWLFGWGKGKGKDTHLGEGDQGFTHLSEPIPDNGGFALGAVRQRPEQPDRGGSRIVALPKGRYEKPPQVSGLHP